MNRHPSSSYRPLFHGMVGDLGDIPVPYDIPADCYAQPTDDYPHEGGFGEELRQDMEACEGCRTELANPSGSWCQGVRQACEGWNIIPAGIEPGAISDDMLSACVSQCQHDQAAALVARYCNTSSRRTPPKITPTPGKTPIVTPASDTDTTKKTSLWPWLVGGIVIVTAAGVALWPRTP